MSRRTDLQRWNSYLEAESSGREVEAEALLFEMFNALPAVFPPAGFAHRVMASVSPRSPFAARWVRLSLAAGLLIAGLGAGWLLPAVPAMARLIDPTALLSKGIGLLSHLTFRFASGVASWQLVGDTAETLARALASPTVAGLLLAQLIVAAGALRALAVLASKGSTRHVVS